MIGPSIGFGLTTSFDQEERIESPSDATFENGQKTRFVYSGSIPDAASFFAGVVLGIRYELPMKSDKSMSIVPELTYTLGLTSLQSSQDWGMGSIRAGVSVQWNTWITPTPPPPPPPPPPHSTTATATGLAGSSCERDQR
ncbi:MAG: hypothetical protein IPI29_06605 [Ignavibacteria bacterium]|nr:hypothetical protein [Ignavibacteria bacterium]